MCEGRGDPSLCVLCPEPSSPAAPCAEGCFRNLRLGPTVKKPLRPEAEHEKRFRVELNFTQCWEVKNKKRKIWSRTFSSSVLKKIAHPRPEGLASFLTLSVQRFSDHCPQS